MTIRVFVVDDHVIVRAGVCMILGGQSGVEIGGHAECGEDALPQLRKLRPDVLVCDVHLPGISGLEVTERVVRGGYGTRVVVVSAQHQGPLPRRAMEAGASAYVGKSHDSTELLRALQDVAHGRRYLATGIAQMSARSPVTMAMHAMTLDALTDGRFRLGVGVSGPQVVEGWYGRPFGQPLARTREYIDILRQVWRREDPVTNAGPHYPLPYDGPGAVARPRDEALEAAQLLDLGAFGHRPLVVPEDCRP